MRQGHYEAEHTWTERQKVPPARGMESCDLGDGGLGAWSPQLVSGDRGKQSRAGPGGWCREQSSLPEQRRANSGCHLEDSDVIINCTSGGAGCCSDSKVLISVWEEMSSETMILGKLGNPPATAESRLESEASRLAQWLCQQNKGGTVSGTNSNCLP